MKALAISAAIIGITLAGIPSGDKVTSMPDVGTPSFDMYSGYINLNDTKKLHYVFAYS